MRTRSSAELDHERPPPGKVVNLLRLHAEPLSNLLWGEQSSHNDSIPPGFRPLLFGGPKSDADVMRTDQRNAGIKPDGKAAVL